MLKGRTRRFFRDVSAALFRSLVQRKSESADLTNFIGLFCAAFTKGKPHYFPVPKNRRKTIQKAAKCINRGSIEI